jgi:hypothetical protein
MFAPLTAMRTGQIVATVILALATIGFGFLWMVFAIVGGFQAGHHEDFGLPMVVYYSPWYITGLWIVNLIVFLRDMFTRKNRNSRPPPQTRRQDG